MNERIKELIEQATESTGFLTAGDSVKPLPVREFNKEKFAQLIVRECCDWIDGSPANDAGQLHLTKSFIIDNLKGMFRSKE